MDRRAQLLLLLFVTSVGLGAWAAALFALGQLGRLPLRSPGPGASDWALWIATPPWWAAALLWLAANAVLVDALRRMRTGIAAGAPEMPDGFVKPSTTTRLPQLPPGSALPPSLDAFLNPPRMAEVAGIVHDPDGIWRVRARLNEQHPALQVFLDHAVGTETRSGLVWRPFERILLAERSDLRPGDALTIEILGPLAGRDDAWTWLPEGENGIRAPLPGGPHRCRLVFAADYRTKQNSYFVLLRTGPAGAAGSPPFLVADDVFGFRDAWEAEAPLERIPRWRGR